MSRVNQAESEAIEWLIRLRDGEQMDWQALTIWLEAEPRNSEAFDRLSVADAELENLSVPEVSSPVRNNTWRVAAIAIGSAVAASLVIVAAIPRSDLYRIETKAGRQRILALPDGSRAELNGGTVIMLDRKQPRLVSLERGEAYFSVVHNAQDPFTVQVGGARIVDVGTAFDVVRTSLKTEIGVSEGAVAFQSSSGSVQVQHGSQLRVEGAQATLSSVAAGSVGSWREGQLVYVDTPLPTVAADIQRARGLRVRIDPNLSGRLFSGTIELKGRDPDLMRRVAVLTGSEAVHGADGWTLTSARAARR